jgi:hypothetical protein
MALAERLRTIARPAVPVIWDRRQRDRRASDRPVSVDHRHRDRRGPPPATWGDAALSRGAADGAACVTPPIWLEEVGVLRRRRVRGAWGPAAAVAMCGGRCARRAARLRRSVRHAVVALERERARLVAQLGQVQAAAPPGCADRLQETVDDLLEALSRFPTVLASGATEQQRAVGRSFLAGIRVNKATRQAMLRWYRLPRGLSVKLVELRGIEPLTPRLPASCSPS